MDRRPHWDASLISAVLADLRDVYDSGYGEEQAFRIIAAVEDWHEKFVMHGAFRVLAERAASAEADRDRLANQLLNEVPDSYIQMKARALDAEAAIARVRELHTPYRIMLGSVPTDTNCNGCNRTYPCPTIRALDGDGDD